MGARIECANCLRPKDHCLCHALILKKTAIKTAIYQHPSEKQQRFKTAHLACAQLEGCNIIDQAELTQLALGAQNVALLFPSSESRELSRSSLKDFDMLLVLDGTWSKAKRLIYENCELQGFTHFHLPPTNQVSKLRPLRRAREDHQLSTLEAIAKAQEIASADPSYQELINVLDIWVELQTRFSCGER